MNAFNGLGLNLGNLSRLSAAQTRSISPENFNGAKGAGGMATTGTGEQCARGLGQGWKVSPSVRIKAGETFTVADISGSGAIQQIWMTPTGPWRHSILRIYWDGQENPSVECPVGDFFGMHWQKFAPLVSQAVCVNPGSAFNCYWEMPFRKHCRITMTNIADEDMVVYYQVNYTLTDVPEDCAYFHAQFRRTNPLPYKEVFTDVFGDTILSCEEKLTLGIKKGTSKETPRDRGCVINTYNDNFNAWDSAKPRDISSNVVVNQIVFFDGSKIDSGL